MNQQSNNFHKFNMLSLGIESPPSRLSAKQKHSYKRINCKSITVRQVKLKRKQTDKLAADIKMIMKMGIKKYEHIYQKLEDDYMMPKVMGESPSDNALRIYVRKAKQQIALENEL